MYNAITYHGILGQRWGVRRFQNKNGTLTNKGKRRYNDSGLHVIDTKNQSTKKSGLTPKQKKALTIGALAVAAALATYGAYKLGAFDKFAKNGEDVTKNIFGKFENVDPQAGFKFDPQNGLDKVGSKTAADQFDLKTGFKLKKNPVVNTIESIAEDVKAINPNGNRRNCVACSVTYDLRRRGLDVVANAVPEGECAFNMNKISEWYKGAKRDYLISDANSVKDEFEKVSNHLLEYGEGARGVLTGQYTNKYVTEPGEGHAIAWQVLNGKVEFVEGQGGYIYSDAFNQFFTRLRPNSVTFTRLDNLEVNADYIKEVTSNRQYKLNV
jgi:hypothetical protein